MGCPGRQVWTWTLCVFFSWMCVGEAVRGPQYMVAVPAVIEAGAETKFCASLMHPNETLVMTVTLMSQEANTTLLKQTSSVDFHICLQFQAPLVTDEEVQNFKVEVHGDTFNSQEVRKVQIKSYRPMTFIQTDKPIYLPGQTVNFRVITLDTKMRPVSQMYNIIELEDSNNNRIGQWLNATCDSKILQRSYDLNAEAREGRYQIAVSIGSDKVFHNFKVEKYVLPKFDVKINSTDEVGIDQEEISAEVCATYTFGQPVPSSITIEVCRPLNSYVTRTLILEDSTVDLTPPCYTETLEADKTGCASFAFAMSTFTKIAQKALTDTLEVSAKVEEEGTGTTREVHKNIRMSYVVGRISFSDAPKIYHVGSDVEGKVKAVYYNDTPIVGMTVHLFEGERWSAKLVQNLTTDSDGLAAFSFSTADSKRDLHFRVSSTMSLGYALYRTPYYDTQDHRVKMAQEPSPDTRTVSSLDVKEKDDKLPCDQEQEFSIHYTIVGEAQDTVNVMYLVLSRGSIVMQGVQQVQVQDKPENEGEVSFKLVVSPNMAPELQVVAYAILPSENVIADSADFAVEKCFSHKVSLEFSPSSAVPGEETTMHMTAQPDSLCGVSAVDQSVLIKEPGKTLDANKIFNLLPVTKATYIPYEVQDSVECLPVRPRRSIMPPHEDDHKDAYTVFQDVGMKMATNMVIRVPTCLTYKGRQYHQGHGYNIVSARFEADAGVARMSMDRRVGSSPRGGAVDSPIETVRTFFPETWIWDLVEVGDTGVKDVPLTVPDTITTWETEAFCLSSQGFGLAPRKQITVFQPFFIELSLPYSIIRGENFELKATIYNYMTSCIMVHVSPTPSLDYTLTPLSGDQYTSCLCGNERKTLSWAMFPIALGVMNVSVTAEAVPSHTSCDNEIVAVPERGRIDVVTRTLIVKPEGTEMTKSYNWLHCPKGETLTEEINIELPGNIVAGSTRASVSVLGDIMGRALKNLDGLLRMPYGCGEQNMALLAPNIYVLQYLGNTNQLTPAIKEKATNFLTSGYQRQLNYKHDDGAYSTFGTGSGNTWLTAFVLRSFAKAQSFIYIDPAKMEESAEWLKTKQRDNGCFERSGKLFNNRMKGGVSDEVTLSAYITAAFLEMDKPVDDPMIKKSLACLRESTSDLSNTYTTALLAYVFTLAKDMKTRALLLDHLDTVAINEGGFLHWSQKAKETSASLSVEISSYVLLAKLSGAPTTEDLGYTSRIVRWLASQQNYYGGFSSTQDTVAALQALTLYSTLVFSSDGASTVTVQSPSGALTFNVDQNNKLLYQEQLVKDAAGKYSLEVKGTTCAATQISLRYNVPTPNEVSTLNVEIKAEADCSSKRPKLSLKLRSLYTGKETSTNMVILDIKMLSGFVPQQESLKALKGSLMVDRVEHQEDHVLVYLQELTKDIPITHSLDLVQELPVQNLKPAVIKIYDYYQPSDHDDTEYIYPCAAGNN